MEEQKWHYLTHSRKDKKVHIFPQDIGLVVEYVSMARETGVQSQVESYQRLKNDTWYLFA